MRQLFLISNSTMHGGSYLAHVLDELASLHGRTRSHAVREAIKEVYLRAGRPFSGTPRAPSSSGAPARSG